MKRPFGMFIHLISFMLCVELLEHIWSLLTFCMLGNAYYVIVDTGFFDKEDNTIYVD